MKNRISATAAAFAALLFLFCAPLRAQDPPPNGRTQLDGLRIELDQIEAGVDKRDVSDAHLAATRRRLEELAVSLRGTADEAAPRAETLRARLKEIGPKPDDKGPPESAELGREREEREKALKEADDTVRLARRLAVQADQLIAAIADKRRAIFTDHLFHRTSSILSPRLWMDVAMDLPGDAAAAGVILRDAASRATERVGVLGASAAFVAVLIVLVLAAAARQVACRFVKAKLHRPTALAMPLSALAFAFAGFALPGAAGFLVYQAATGLGIVPLRLEPVLINILGGLAFIGLVRGLADGILAPDRPTWRMVLVPNDTAEHLVRVATGTAVLLVLGRTVETFNQAIAAGLPLTLATRGIFVAVIALTIARQIRTFRTHTAEDVAAFGSYVPKGRTWYGLGRIAAWLALVAALGAALIGFLALASFLIDQIVWTALVGAVLVLLIKLVDASIEAALAPDGKPLLLLQTSVGLSRKALQQAGVLLSGFSRLFLGGLAVLLVLAPWGVESGDLLFSLRSAVFGFTIGDVTISFATVFSAVAVFVIGIVLTRSVQRWLKVRFLPQTEMDAGLKNSVTTGLGYVGFIAAAAISMSSLGLSLDKLAIVAGALSVGIGFGLQSIVNNFVSGLILLWERSIRVGDLVIVGSDQGHVRRINVRSTEIDTFDRATVIVPNSNLVSGVVKNRVYSDRTSRVVVALPLPREVDPDRVAAMLREAAEHHPDVMEDPPPRVLLKTIGGSSLDFELVCFVADVDVAVRVTSDLNFVIWRRVQGDGLLPPPPPRPELGVEMTREVEVRLTRARPEREPEESR